MEKIEISTADYETLRRSVVNAGAVAGLLLLSLGLGPIAPTHRHAVKALRDDCQLAEKIITDLMVN